MSDRAGRAAQREGLVHSAEGRCPCPGSGSATRRSRGNESSEIAFARGSARIGITVSERDGGSSLRPSACRSRSRAPSPPGRGRADVELLGELDVGRVRDHRGDALVEEEVGRRLRPQSRPSAPRGAARAQDSPDRAQRSSRRAGSGWLYTVTGESAPGGGTGREIAVHRRAAAHPSLQRGSHRAGRAPSGPWAARIPELSSSPSGLRPCTAVELHLRRRRSPPACRR